MKYRTSTSNERVWCTKQLAKLSFNHSIGRAHSWRFSIFSFFWWKRSAVSTADWKWKKLKNVSSCEHDRLNGWNSTKKNEKRQLWARPIEWLKLNFACCVIHEKIENVRIWCEHDRLRLNGWNSTLQAVWYIRHVRWTCLFYTFIVWFLWTKPKLWLLILSFTKYRSRVFYVLSLWKI